MSTIGTTTGQVGWRVELEGRVRVTLQCIVTVAVQRGEEGGEDFLEEMGRL